MNIVVSCVENGLGFSEEGRKQPFVETSTYGDIPVIARVLKSLQDLEFFNAKLILVIQKDYLDNGFYSNMREWLDKVIRCYWGGYCKVVEVSGVQNIVSSTLLVNKYLMNDEELIILGSNQYLEWDAVNFINYAKSYDGCLLTFVSDGDAKWGHIEVGDYNGTRLVDKVEVEQPLLCGFASMGLYYFQSGLLYLNAVASMIQKSNKKIFHVAEVYKELLREYRISNYTISSENMFYLGDPASLKNSIKRMNW